MYMKIRFFPLDAEYKIVDGKPIIHIFGKHNDEFVCLKYEMEPYFYVLPKNLDQTKDFLRIVNVNNVTIAKQEIITKSYLGKNLKLIKCIVKIPSEVPPLRDYLIREGYEVFEADILFNRRFFVDKEIVPLQEYEVEVEEEGIYNKLKSFIAKSFEPLDKFYDKPKVIAFDIETYPDEKGLNQFSSPILMFSLYGENYKKVVSWKGFETDLDYVEFVSSEQELIQKFIELIESLRPDIITGYFSDKFDLPYILERARKYKLNVNFNLDGSQLNVGRGNIKTVRTIGIQHIDIYNCHSNILRTALKSDSLKLDSVAEELLGKKKVDVDIMELANAWDNKDDLMLTKFAEYNLQDSFLTYELFMELFPSISEMVKIVGQTLSDTSRMSVSQLVEWFLIKNSVKKEFNVLIPNKPSNDQTKYRQMQRLKGAFVFEPIPGLYKNIVIYDFRSLYPTIIGSHNLSQDTMNCECCSETSKKIIFEKKTIWFCEKKKGFLPTMIEDLIVRRMRVKEIMKETPSHFLKARQNGLKLLANSFYGYLSFYGARWYSFDSANSTTYLGREYIHTVIDTFEKSNFNVIYSDTDSVFVVAEDMKSADKVVDGINKNLPGLMDLENEGFYPAGIFVATKGEEGGAKKKYALIDSKDNIVIKGFETIRRNTAKIGQEVQRKVLTIILKENDPAKALDYVKLIIGKVKNNELDVSEFRIRTKLTKEIDEYDSVGPHVVIAQRMRDLGMSVGQGSLIDYVITKEGKKIRDKAKLISETKKEDIDFDYYIDNQILPNVEQIFEVFKLDIKEFNSKGQSTLGKFF